MLVERAFDGKRHVAVHQGKQGVVLTDADIDTRVELGAALTHDDGASADRLTTKSLHTEHLGLGIAPVSRRAAAFFLCHDLFPLCRNGADQQFGELLTMTLPFLVVLATAHLEDADLVVLAVCQYRDTHCCAGHQGRTHFQFSAVADGQNLVEYDFLAYVRSNLFYFNFFTSSNSVLLAAGFYDRVHIDLFSFALGMDFHRAHDYSIANLTWRLAWARPRATPAQLPIIVRVNRSQTLQTDPPSPAAPMAIIAQDMRDVDRVIAQRLDSGVPLVGQVSRYIIAAGGKRLRPALLLLCCGAMGFAGAQRFNMAAVVEFIHTATLLHDDVVDDSALRRGNATANETFGNPASVLVGDFLYSRAFQMMVEAGDMRIMAVLADATNVIAEGEVLQLMNMHNAELDEASYLQVIRSKTAKLFEASALVGAILSGGSPALEAACADYGQALGTAFQVIDDVLDYAGDSEVMGKSLGDDLREGKATLPLIAAMQRGTPEERALIKGAVEAGNSDLLHEVIQIVHRTGALDVARQAAGAEAARAVTAARQLPPGPHADCLIALAAALLQRQA